MLKDELFVAHLTGWPNTSRRRMAKPARAALHELQVTLEADDSTPPGIARPSLCHEQ